jgi:hypothetical protein
VSQSTKDNPKAPKRSSRRKPAMEPLGWDEIVSQPGMGGYLSFLNGPIPLPHLHPPAPEPYADPVVVSDPDVATSPGVLPTERAMGRAGDEAVSTPAPVVASIPEVVRHPDVGITPALDPTPVIAPSSPHPLAPSAQAAPVVISTPGAVQHPDVAASPGVVPTPAIAPSPPHPLAHSAPRARPRIRKCAAAHDGHSLGEEVLYQALWKAAAAESAGARIIVIGWRGMSQLCRMTPKNCKINTQRLIRKLALEILSPYNTPESIGTTYRIFPSEAILHRRRAAGLEWVVRSRGVEFVDPATGISVSAHLCGYASEQLSPS